MERHDTQLGDTVVRASCTLHGKGVVIFDDGDRAWLRRAPETIHLEIGTRLRYAGQVWQITEHRPHAKAFVAQPIPH